MQAQYSDHLPALHQVNLNCLQQLTVRSVKMSTLTDLTGASYCKQDYYNNVLPLWSSFYSSVH